MNEDDGALAVPDPADDALEAVPELGFAEAAPLGLIAVVVV